MPVHRHDGAYYIYSPEQSGHAGRHILTDTVLYVLTPDGYWPKAILSCRYLHKNHYQLDIMASSYNDKFELFELHIYHIDKYNLSVWAECRSGESIRYRLMTPLENAHRYDMVVTSAAEVWGEYDGFDKINFEQLLINNGFEPPVVSTTLE